MTPTKTELATQLQDTSAQLDAATDRIAELEQQAAAASPDSGLQAELDQAKADLEAGPK